MGGGRSERYTCPSGWRGETSSLSPCAPVSRVSILIMYWGNSGRHPTFLEFHPFLAILFALTPPPASFIEPAPKNPDITFRTLLDVSGWEFGRSGWGGDCFTLGRQFSNLLSWLLLQGGQGTSFLGISFPLDSHRQKDKKYIYLKTDSEEKSVRVLWWIMTYLSTVLAPALLIFFAANVDGPSVTIICVPEMDSFMLLVPPPPPLLFSLIQLQITASSQKKIKVEVKGRNGLHDRFPFDFIQVSVFMDKEKLFSFLIL